MPYLTLKAHDMDWKFTDKECQKHWCPLPHPVQVSEPRIHQSLRIPKAVHSAASYLTKDKESCYGFQTKAICPLEDASAAFRSMGDRVKPSCRFSGAHGHQQISCEVSLRNKYWGSTVFHSSLIQRFCERLMFSWFLGLRGSSLAQVKRLTSTAPFLLSNRLSGRLFHTRAFIEHLWCAREGGNSRISVP